MSILWGGIILFFEYLVSYCYLIFKMCYFRYGFSLFKKFFTIFLCRFFSLKVLVLLHTCQVSKSNNKLQKSPQGNNKLNSNVNSTKQAEEVFLIVDGIFHSLSDLNLFVMETCNYISFPY